MSYFSFQFPFRKCLNLTLCLSLALPARLVFAREITDEQFQQIAQHLSPTELEAFSHILGEISSLGPAFANPSGPLHPLDEFDLLQQNVVDQRKERIQEKIERIESEDFQIRRQEEVQFLLAQAQKNRARTLDFIGTDKVQIAAQILGLSPDQDLEKIIEAARENDQIADLFDIRPEQLEHFVDEDVPPRRLYRMNLRVNVLKQGEGTDDDPEPTENLYMNLKQTDAEGSTSRSFQSDRFFKIPDQGTYRFDITLPSGETIHNFNRPIAAVGFYSRFLVYVDRDDRSNLKFIDLDYFKGAIGNTPLPAFKLPLQSGATVEEIRIEKGQLRLNDQLIPNDVLSFVADLYRIYFNIKVSLMDPQTASSAVHLVKELSYFKDQAMLSMDSLETQMIESALGGAEGLSTFVSKMETQLETQAKVGPVRQLEEVPSKLKDGLAEQPELLMTFTPSIKVIEDEVLHQDRLTQVNRSIMVSRQFTSRLHLLMAKIVRPQPMGSPKILAGMAMLAESGLRGQWTEFQQNWKDLKRNPVVAYGRFGASVLAAAAVGVTLSDSFALSLYDGLQTGGQMIVDYLHHTDYGRNFVRLMGHAGQKALSGIPGTQNYFSADVLPRLGVLGTALAGLVLSIYGCLHLTANTLATARYMSQHRGWIQQARAQGSNRIEAYRDAFVKYQNALLQYYNKNLAQSEAASSSGKTRFNKAQSEVADELHQELKASKKGLLRSLGRSVASSASALNRTIGSLFNLGKEAETIEDGKIKTLGQALGQFALSYPSALITSRFAGKLWNYWFMIRSFALVPKSWPMFLTYPELFRVGIDGGGNRLHMPTPLNGGYRSHLATWKFARKNTDLDDALADLKRFEKNMLPIEAMTYEVALEKALEVLLQEVKDPNKLKDFFDSASLPKGARSSSQLMGSAAPSAGFRSLSDPKLRRLSSQHRTFFRSVFNQVYEETTEIYLRRFLSATHPEASAETVDDLRRTGIEAAPEIESLLASLKTSQARQVRQEIRAVADQLMADGQVVAQARELSASWNKAGERFLLNTEHDVVSRLDPHNPQVKRFKTAERQLKNVKAVVRAMNSMFTDIVVKKGMGLLTILVMYSAVTDDALRPIQDMKFGPNSWYYGSRYHFLNGFASGVFIAALANVWMKVQVDDRIDDAGGFDKIPTVADRDKSYFRYYLKSFFKNPANKWSSNQLNQMRLIWANLSAAFVTVVLTNMLSMGRFDLGSFLAGYILVFMTPFSGIELKLDQTHELASRWQASKIMRKLRAHPKLQSWINNSIRSKRVPHSILTSTYAFFIGPFIGLYELMNTPEFGKRSFLNLLFFGYQPEEIISQGLQGINRHLGFIPGVESFTSACESLLTTNNTALDPTKLINPPIPGGD